MSIEIRKRPLEKKKGGFTYILQGQDAADRLLVKAGQNIDVAHMRDLRGVIEREGPPSACSSRWKSRPNPC